jgi:uncharacterized DUF497 family protein
VVFDCLDTDAAKGFDWDEGNRLKNKLKHGLDWWLIEEVFFNEPLLVVEDIKHSQNECRCYALGRTDEERLLFVAFTLRGEKIRVISARPMSQKEKVIYEKHS